MRINANIAAVNASRNLTASNDNLGRSVGRPASGVRGHRAHDDGAGLAISEGLQAEIRNSTRAQRKAQDGISYIQTADGALGEVRDVLRRLRQLAQRAAEPADDGAAAAPTDVDVLLAELRTIGQRTTFSGSAVFADWSTSALSFQVAGEELTAIDRNLELSPDSDGVFGDVLGIDLSTPGAALTALGVVDTALDDVESVHTGLGAARDQLERTVANLAVAVENLLSSVTHLRSVDDAADLLRATRGRVLADRTAAEAAQATSPVPQSMLLLLQG